MSQPQALPGGGRGGGGEEGRKEVRMSEEEDTCVSYEEEDTCVSYEEEDTCGRKAVRMSTLINP
jgi:hypothetical protein